jgi:photosystem II stability/assembly factor-like uncharacterized protein
MISGKQIVLALGLVLFTAISCATPPVLCQWRLVYAESGTAFNQFQFLNAHEGFAHDDECLWKTENGGKHWRKIYCASRASADLHNNDAIERFQFIDASEGWLLTNGSLLRHTLDGGKSWTWQEFPGYIIRGFRFIDAKRGWWVGEKSLPGAPDLRGAIFFTEEKGDRWTEQDSGIKPKSRWRLQDVWPRTDREAWAVGDNFLLHTVDGGKSWMDSSFPELGRLRNNEIRFFDNTIGVIFRSPADNFLLSLNGGGDWSTRRLPLKMPTLDGLIFTSAKEAWAAIAGGIYHSGDSGSSWQLILSNHKEATNGDMRFYRFYSLQYIEHEKLLIAASDNDGFAFCSLRH